MDNLSDKQVLDLIRAGRAETQAELCRITGLGRSTMSYILKRLRDGGLVQSVGTRILGRGKPTTVLRFAPRGHLLAISIEGSQTDVGLLNFSGAVLQQQTLEMGLDPAPESLLRKLERVARKLVKKARLEWRDLRAVGIQVNGFVSAQGVVQHSAVLPWRNVPLAQMARDIFGLTVFCSDPRERAVAEYRQGAGQGSHVMLFFNVGDGVSARAVVDGQLFKGAHRCGGEIGHQVVSPAGPLCGCGQRGCLEAYISGLSIARRIAGDAQSNKQLQKDVAVKRLVQLAREGRAAKAVDELVRLADLEHYSYAQRLIDEVLGLAGKALAGAVACFDPDCIVVDGYVFRDRPVLMRRLWQAANANFKVPGTAGMMKFTPAMLGPEARFLPLVAAVGDGLAQEGRLTG
jgi:glucokinase